MSAVKLAAKALVLFFLVAGTIWLATLRGSGEEIPPGRVVITYWEKWTAHEAAQMQQIVDEFNRTVGAEKGIYVQYLSMSNVHQKTLVATAAGVPPDIAGLWNNQVAQFAALDAVLPLDEMAAEHGITEGYYKRVYWEGCSYDGRLYAMVSTPAAVALHYNKQLFLERADALREAGLDPTRPPQTLDELNRYAEALDVLDERGRMRSAGYLPMEPGWFLNFTGFWFGAELYDPHTDRITIDTPEMLEAFTWVQSYSKRLGTETLGDFRSGFGTYNSPQNPFINGEVVMVQQGPWMANLIENQRPAMNRWRMSKEEERALPREERRQNYQWGAAPFPAANPAGDPVTYCSFDVLMIPRGSRHPREAFEFIAYVNRQDVMERLNMMHCKNSPLAQVSREFIENHPNPYIEVFEELAASPGARGIPPVPIFPQVEAELNNAGQRIFLMTATPQEALRDAQERVDALYDRFREHQAQRRGEGR